MLTWDDVRWISPRLCRGCSDQANIGHGGCIVHQDPFFKSVSFDCWFVQAALIDSSITVESYHSNVVQFCAIGDSGGDDKNHEK